jgi:hypothetical protein
MSYIARPRIGFFASNAMTSPSTANNENMIHILDPDNVEYLNPPVVEGAQLPALDDVSYREWMTSLIAYSDPLDSLNDPTQPDWQPGMPGYWNYYGDHLTTFGSASVNGVWLPGDATEPDTTDPLCGARVAFDAKLVDLDPADTFTSQLIAASFSVVGADASGQSTELVSGIPTIGHSRWLNFFRPGGAGTFQCVIPNEALKFVDEAQAPDSPALAALRAGAAAGGGLVLRYCLYNMAAKLSMQEMYDSFQQGQFLMNPKYGNVLGTLGVWNGQDMQNAPVGRILEQQGPPFFSSVAEAASEPLRVKTHEDVERVFKPGSKAFAQSEQTEWAAKMGPAVAVVEADRVTLDLLTSFPEEGGDLAKHDFGPVELVLETDDGKQVGIGPVPYDRTTYENQAGVVEVALSPGLAPLLGDGSLRLVAADTLLLREIEVVQVETDDRNLYLDLELVDGALEATGSMELRAFWKGEPIKSPVTVTLQHFEDVMKPGTANSVNPLVVTACELTEQPSGIEGSITIPAGGRAAVTITSTRPGCFKVRFLPPPMKPDDKPMFQVEFFGSYRTLPFNDYSHVPDEDITWPFLYEHVFKYYAVMYPVMSLIMPWGPSNMPYDPDRVVQFASLIRMAVDESHVGTALAMPVTRELSAGKRTLVQRWCDLQLGDSRPDPPGR